MLTTLQKVLRLDFIASRCRKRFGNAAAELPQAVSTNAGFSAAIRSGLIVKVRGFRSNGLADFPGILA
jgi:hypothetical protein